jgi:hypothetical protein
MQNSQDDIDSPDSADHSGVVRVYFATKGDTRIVISRCCLSVECLLAFSRRILQHALQSPFICDFVVANDEALLHSLALLRIFGRVIQNTSSRAIVFRPFCLRVYPSGQCRMTADTFQYRCSGNTLKSQRK